MSGYYDLDPELHAHRVSRRWKVLRGHLLSESPLCAVCRRLGRYEAATEIHHIVPAREMLDRYGSEGFYDERNLVNLCHRCHVKHENAWRFGESEVFFGVTVRW